jgi:glyoxylase-like metal-dependent hydrolase (beta-lactamase superfamily II)
VKHGWSNSNRVSDLEIGPGVYYLEIGNGINRSNVYFVQSGTAWVLIDTASANCGQVIRRVAESLFGSNTRPASILLTHVHPDHAGSALELAHLWDCQVYMHPDELPLAIDRDLSTIQKYANPLDRWMILPLLRLMPRHKVESMLVKTGLKDVAQGFAPDASIPDLPDWKCIPTPGHTPGHVAFFRPDDRLLISGDAVVTVDLNSFWGLLMWSLQQNQQRLSGPPRYSTWKWQTAKQSVTVLAKLEPRVLAPGHGLAISGDETARQLHAFADHF